MADRETIIETDSGDGGFAAGMAVAILAIVLLMIAGGYIFFTNTGSGPGVFFVVFWLTVNTAKS